MVFAVILLLTVSSLAAHVNAIPTKGLPNELVVQQACKGKTLCDIRPENYPQEEIDRLVVQNLHHLHRIKRQAEFGPLADSLNNCIKKIEPKQFYTIESSEGLHEPIVQSRFFDQTVPMVECESQEGMCFEDITNESGKKFVCETVYTDISFAVHTKDGTIEERPSRIAIDCMCAEK